MSRIDRWAFLAFPFVCAAAFIVTTSIAGCDRPPSGQANLDNSKSVFKLPEGLPDDRHIRITQETHSGGSTETAKGTGAGMTASGDKASIGDFKSAAPTVGNGGASGGSTSGDLSAAVSGENRWLIGGVILAVLGAGFCTWRALSNPITAKTWFRGAIVCGGIAGCLLACAVAPALAIFIGVGGAAAMVGLYLYEMRNHAGQKVKAITAAQDLGGVADTANLYECTLKAIKTAIDKAPDTVKGELLPRLSAAMDRQHKAVIKEL